MTQHQIGDDSAKHNGTEFVEMRRVVKEWVVLVVAKRCLFANGTNVCKTSFIEIDKASRFLARLLRFENVLVCQQCALALVLEIVDDPDAVCIKVAAGEWGHQDGRTAIRKDVLRHTGESLLIEIERDVAVGRLVIMAKLEYVSPEQRIDKILET